MSTLPNIWHRCQNQYGGMKAGAGNAKCLK